MVKQEKSGAHYMEKNEFKGSCSVNINVIQKSYTQN